MPEVIPGFPGGVSQPATWLLASSHCSVRCVRRSQCDISLFYVDLFFSACVGFRFQTADGEVKYVREAEELIRPERNTLLVSFTDLEGFNQELATTIQEEYYRWAPFLCCPTQSNINNICRCK